MIYATYAEFGGRHVWRSEDFGETWEAIDGSGASAMPDIPVHSVVVDPGNVRRIYLGTDLGVFTSGDRGRTWAVENTGFANAVTEWLAIGDGPDDRPQALRLHPRPRRMEGRSRPTQEAPRQGGGRVAP